MGVLPDEIVIDVLIGLRHFSLQDFMKLFDFLLLQAKAKAGTH